MIKGKEDLQENLKMVNVDLLTYQQAIGGSIIKLDRRMKNVDKSEASFDLTETTPTIEAAETVTEAKIQDEFPPLATSDDHSSVVIIGAHSGMVVIEYSARVEVEMPNHGADAREAKVHNHLLEN